MISKKQLKIFFYILPCSLLLYLLLWQDFNLKHLISESFRHTSTISNQTNINISESNCTSYNSSSGKQIFNNQTIYSNKNTSEMEMKGYSIQTMYPKELSAKMFKVLVYKSPYAFKYFFSDTYDPSKNCSVKNCIFTNNIDSLLTSHAVIIHIREVHYKDLPVHRNLHQYWTFFVTESPYNVFAYHGINWGLENYNDVFNWTMTYRSDSSVPIPCGRRALLEPNERQLVNTSVNFAANKTKLIAWVSSNCVSGTVRNNRDKFIKSLQKFIPIDTYGKCGKFSCPGHFDKPCEYIKQYKFYLAVENSNCIDYITEKVWSNSFESEVVPVVLGARKEDYIKVTPPNSFIFAEDFSSMENLAKYLLYLNKNDTAYNQYFEWKKEYKIESTSWNMGGKPFYLCEVCKKLNEEKNTGPKSYTISEWWSPKTNCFGTQWESKLIKN